MRLSRRRWPALWWDTFIRNYGKYVVHVCSNNKWLRKNGTSTLTPVSTGASKLEAMCCRYINPAGPTTGKRKRALSSLQNQNIYMERSRTGNSSLTINGKLIKFKSGADFSAILRKKGRAYFDRTRYISVLDAYDDEPILFFRPRRFGKSLTVNMLEHFHGLQYRDEHRSSYQVCDYPYLVCARLTFSSFDYYRTSTCKKILQKEE